MQIMQQAMNFRVPPNRRLRNVNPGMTVALISVPPNRRLRKDEWQISVLKDSVPPNRRLRNCIVL